MGFALIAALVGDWRERNNFHYKSRDFHGTFTGTHYSLSNRLGCGLVSSANLNRLSARLKNSEIQKLRNKSASELI